MLGNLVVVAELMIEAGKTEHIADTFEAFRCFAGGRRHRPVARTIAVLEFEGIGGTGNLDFGLAGQPGRGTWRIEQRFRADAGKVVRGFPYETSLSGTP